MLTGGSPEYILKRAESGSGQQVRTLRRVQDRSRVLIVNAELRVLSADLQGATRGLEGNKMDCQTQEDVQR